MSDFEDKMQSILGNPDAMSQIMSIAKALTGDGAGSGASGSQPEIPPSAEHAPAFSHEESGPAQPAQGGDSSLFSLLGDLDPSMIQMGMKLFSEYSDGGDDRRVALLGALRPFVKEKRYETVDRAMQIAKLSRVIRVALQVFKGGGKDV